MTSVAPATVVYRSAVDSWLLVVLGGAMLMSATACGLVVMAGDAGAIMIALLSGALGVGLPLWILTSTSYTLTADQLIVRSGPLRWRIPLAHIREVAPTSSLLSAPALSLRRWRIDSADGSHVVISPVDPAAFVADLRARQGMRDDTLGAAAPARPGG